MTPPGQVQVYPRFARVLLFVLAVLFLAGAITVYGIAPPAGATDWFGIGGTAAIALFCFGAFHYYSRLTVRVTPESVVVSHPFKGTLRVTHDNVISIARIAYSNGSSATRFIFDDGGRKSVDLSNTAFDLRLFTRPFPPPPTSKERAATIRRLELAGVRRRMYAFDSATEENQLVCRKVTVGRLSRQDVWQVAFFERGRYGTPTNFRTEAEAYNYFVMILARWAQQERWAVRRG